MGGIRERGSFHVLEILGFVGLFEEYDRVLPLGGAVVNGFKKIRRVRLNGLCGEAWKGHRFGSQWEEAADRRFNDTRVDFWQQLRGYNQISECIRLLHMYVEDQEGGASHGCVGEAVLYGRRYSGEFFIVASVAKMIVHC